MGLRELAKRDVKYIISGDRNGPRWPVEVTDPDGNVSSCLYCTSADIHLFIDPQTGQPISGRQASVTFVISDLLDEQPFSNIPVAILDGTKPWTIKFDDINGLPFVFTVLESRPDRTFGIVPCLLEVYRETA